MTRKRRPRTEDAPDTMTRPEKTEQPSENAFHMTPEEIEAWHAEGREMRVSLAERIAARKKQVVDAERPAVAAAE